MNKTQQTKDLEARYRGLLAEREVLDEALLELAQESEELTKAYNCISGKLGDIERRLAG